jgi:hypothetical protein
MVTIEKARQHLDWWPHCTEMAKDLQAFVAPDNRELTFGAPWPLTQLRLSDVKVPRTP